jgi:MFS transporter, PPP family, 3-phenylpropionic acid transporter
LPGFSAFTQFVVLYTALYAAFGVLSPFLPAYLRDHGVDAAQIGLLIGAGTAVRLIAGPFAGHLADQYRAWRILLVICAAGAAVMALAYVPARGFWPLLPVSVAQAAALAPLAPIADALALSASTASARPFEYGWVRGAGSAAFVAGSILAGHMAGWLGLGTIIWLNAALLAAAAFAALPVPNIAGPSRLRSAERKATSLRILMRIGPYRRVLVIAALVLGSHALHDTFAVIRWRDAGIATGTASLLWSESVGAEVLVFFLAGPPLVRRLGAAGALAIAAAAGMLRWIVLGATKQLVPLALVEPLHGLTFALLHLACMAVIAATVPRALAASAQAIYGTLAVGAAVAAVTLISGWLYETLAGRSFWVMAALCAAALPFTWDLRRSMPDAGARQHPSATVPDRC